MSIRLALPAYLHPGQRWLAVLAVGLATFSVVTTKMLEVGGWPMAVCRSV